MEKAGIESTFQAVSSAMFATDSFKDGTLIDTSALPDLDKQYLSEHFLLSKPLEETRIGQGILVGDQSDLIAFLNLEDHLCLETICPTSNWDETLKKITKLEKVLSSHLEFAFSSTFGFLTSDPAICGTGLTIETFLHLPGLIHSGKLNSIIEDIDEEVLIHGATGNNTFYGDIVIIQNKFTLGVTEDQLMECVHKAAAKLHSEEVKVRGKVQQEEDSSFKDRISRAFGLLKNAYQIETEEALEALSLIKLGVELGWVKGIDNLMTNALFFHCRKGHLALSSEEEEARARSSLFHQKLDGMELQI